MKLAVTTAVIVAFAAGSAFAAGEKKGHSDGAAHGSTTYSATTTQTTTISPASYRGLSFNLQDTKAKDRFNNNRQRSMAFANCDMIVQTT